MVALPENQVTQDDLTAWYQMQDQLKKLRAAEMLLRKKIFAAYFPEPKEGVNSVPLAAGWVMKGDYKIDRSIDEGALGAMRPLFAEHKISVDSLVKYKPELVTRNYRTLTEEQRQLFDRALVVKPGSPSLEIVLPAAAKKAGEKHE